MKTVGRKRKPSVPGETNYNRKNSKKSAACPVDLADGKRMKKGWVYASSAIL